MGSKECYKLGYIFGGLSLLPFLAYHLSSQSLDSAQSPDSISMFEGIQNISLYLGAGCLSVASYFGFRGVSLENRIDNE